MPALLGLGLTPIAVTQLLKVLDWRWIFLLVAIPGLLVAWLSARVLRKPRPIEGPGGTALPGLKQHVWHDALRYRNVPLAIFSMLCWLSCNIVIAALFPSYLVDHLGLNTQQMGWVLSGLGFGGALGSLSIPLLSDHLGRKPVMLLAAGAARAIRWPHRVPICEAESGKMLTDPERSAPMENNHPPASLAQHPGTALGSASMLAIPSWASQNKHIVHMLSVAARHFLTVLCLFCLGAMACALPARAEANRVEVVATDPASPATLNKFDKLNFRIGYSSDRRVRVRVEPFYNGKRVPATNGGMVTYEAGGGEAYFWISFNDAVKIDRADVMLLDDATDKTIATASAALDILWSGVATGTIRPDADWAQRLGADTQRRAKDDSARRDAKRRASGGGFLDTASDLAVEVAGWMVPGYFILQAVFLFRWKGGWRKAALVPLAPMGLLFGYVFYATVIRGSNIAPVVIFFAAPVGFIYLAVLWLLRWSALKTNPA